MGSLADISWSSLLDCLTPFLFPPSFLSLSEHIAQASLLSPKMLAIIAPCEIAYADLLYRWDLLQRRAKLLKLVHPKPPSGDGPQTIPPLTPPSEKEDALLMKSPQSGESYLCFSFLSSFVTCEKKTIKKN